MIFFFHVPQGKNSFRFFSVIACFVFWDGIYNLDFDILEVDTNGNTVTVGFSSINNIDNRYIQWQDTVIIDNHPEFDSCAIE